jgi:polyisoprenoid-binding protein YceI
MLRKNANCLALALLFALSCSAQAAPGAKSKVTTYRISKSYTTLSFTATKWMVFKEEGLFQDFSGTLSYDPANPAACAIDVTAQAASLDTRNSTRDQVLRSDDFFDVAKYPTLAFHNTSIASTGPDSLSVTGDLTIHGITRRVTVPVRVIGARVMPGIGDFAGFETTFTIDRRDFGVLGTRWSGNKVAIDPSVVIHLLIGGVRD